MLDLELQESTYICKKDSKKRETELLSVMHVLFLLCNCYCVIS